MKTILIPTDFSVTAKNAMHYGIEFAKQTGIEKIILYNAYQPSPVSDPVLTSVDLYQIDEFKKISEDGLAKIKTEAEILCGKKIAVEAISEFNSVSGGIYELTEKNKIDLIVMAISSTDKVEEMLAGSNTLHIAKHSAVPVISAPANAVFSPIKKVLLACDFKEVLQTTPAGPIKNILGITGAKLLVLHATHDNKGLEPGTAFESLMLDTLFREYHPEYYFTDNADFAEGINEVAAENNIDLIITISKKHGFFEGLFKRSHTKDLVFHTHVPLMIVHE